LVPLSRVVLSRVEVSDDVVPVVPEAIAPSSPRVCVADDETESVVDSLAVTVCGPTCDPEPMLSDCVPTSESVEVCHELPESSTVSSPEVTRSFRPLCRWRC